ncbi:MAG TPA: Nif3-like dinuclear metal center hexameric protein [Solirubrobacteraceae bacterium]|nr:Nif3-like dinuclear metal center hexameric protein [Solirubrobacteraceae bacterium]
MPARLANILAQADRLLEPDRFQDHGPNGLQVPRLSPAGAAGAQGEEEISTLATGVSASLELFALAAREQAELLVVHHGLFWGSGGGPLDVQMARRLRALFDARMALAAYHLPLDAHPELGNNALLAKALGAERLDRPFGMHRGQAIGCLARFPGEGIPASDLFTRAHRATEREPLVFPAAHHPVVSTVAIVSGAGVDFLPEAAAAGAQAFLTGEPTERAMAMARELEVHFVAAGHYATETFGVRALGERLAGELGLKHVFLDVPNPI